jgi:type II secretory pathway pseudopilin PulG
MVLVIVMVVATLLLIALTATLPSVYQEGQREREAELIFRGTQYARAVALFHRQFNRYPVSMKELLQTNGMRFLRQEYRDPMDPKGKWRFIHVNAAGMLLDSINQRTGNNQKNPAGIGVNNSSSTSSTSGGSLSFGGSNSLGFQGGGTGMGMNPPTGGSGQIGPTSSFFGGQNQIQGAYIAGVAATSHHESIKIWKKYHHYDEWEFIGLDMGVFGIQVGMPTLGAPGMGQQPTSQGFGSSPGGFGLSTTPPNVGPPQN